MIFAAKEKLWTNIRREFHGNFRDMVSGDTLPGDEEVLECIALIRDALPRGK